MDETEVNRIASLHDKVLHAVFAAWSQSRNEPADATGPQADMAEAPAHLGQQQPVVQPPRPVARGYHHGVNPTSANSEPADDGAILSRPAGDSWVRGSIVKPYTNGTSVADLSPTDADRDLLNAFLATEDSSDLSPTTRMPDSTGREAISAQNLRRITHRPMRPFSSDEVGFLQAGDARFGAGQWKKILATYKFADHRTSHDLANKHRNLSIAVQRVEQQQSVPVRPLSTGYRNKCTRKPC